MVRLSLVISILTLAGCSAPSAPDPYAELTSGLWITFIDNPAAQEGTCNPLIEAAYRGEPLPLALQISMRVNSTSTPAAVVLMEPTSTPDLMIGRDPMYADDPFEGTCAEMSLWLLQLKCTDPVESGYVDCPSLGRSGGYRMFGSVRDSL